MDKKQKRSIDHPDDLFISFWPSSVRFTRVTYYYHLAHVDKAFESSYSGDVIKQKWVGNTR
jgi:hypothetical protein